MTTNKDTGAVQLPPVFPDDWPPEYGRCGWPPDKPDAERCDGILELEPGIRWTWEDPGQAPQWQCPKCGHWYDCDAWHPDEVDYYSRHPNGAY